MTSEQKRNDAATHEPHMVSRNDPSYGFVAYATCACGWHGPTRALRTTVLRDQAAHLSEVTA